MRFIAAVVRQGFEGDPTLKPSNVIALRHNQIKQNIQKNKDKTIFHSPENKLL